MEHYIRFVSENLPAFVVGIASSLCAVSILFTVRILADKRRNGRYRGHTGHYYGYHFSISDPDRLVKTIIEIRYRLGKLTVRESSDHYHYSGDIYVTDANLFIRTRGKLHTELRQAVYPNPASARIDHPLVGVTACISPINEPYAYLGVLSPEELNFTDVRHLLDSESQIKTPYYFRAIPDVLVAGLPAVRAANVPK